MRDIETIVISDPARLPDKLLTELLDAARPRVLRGLCRDWQVAAAARESDSAFAHLLAAHDNGTAVDTLLLAPEQRGRIGHNADFSGFNYKHFKVTVTEALQKLALYSRQPAHVAVHGVAMQSAFIRECLPGLLPTLPMPLLSSEVQPRLWFGNRVVTPTHFDTSHNIAVVACGRRRFTLFPPTQAENLYIGPPDFAPTQMPICIAHPDQAGDPRFPRLRIALEHARSAVLEPGDALYMPPLWWHHVQSLDALNALVNFWWQTEAPDAQAIARMLRHAMPPRALAKS